MTTIISMFFSRFFLFFFYSKHSNLKRKALSLHCWFHLQIERCNYISFGLQPPQLKPQVLTLHTTSVTHFPQKCAFVLKTSQRYGSIVFISHRSVALCVCFRCILGIPELLHCNRSPSLPCCSPDLSVTGLKKVGELILPTSLALWMQMYN